MKNVFTACLFVLFGLTTFAAVPFTAGNIVVLRVGDGTGTLTNASKAVFLDEYTPTGTLVRSIAMPTAVSGSNRMFTLSGTATTEGELTLSANGQYLVAAGYDVAPGTASVATADMIDRTIARIGIDGAPNTISGIVSGGAYVKSNIRGAVSNDGTGFWTSGNSSAPVTAGVFYVPFGSFATVPKQISSTVTNTRAINIFNGQLYVSTGSGNFKGVNAVGTGLPTTTGQTITAVSGISSVDTASNKPGSPYGFHFFDMDNTVPGVDVVYICDDRTRGGLMKFSLVGSNWVYSGKDSSIVGVRNVTGVATGGSVKLFVTTETNLYTLTDATGYNQKLTSKLTSIATAGTNKKFRGVAFAPAVTCASPITANISSVTNVLCNGATTGALNVTTTGGSNNYTYDWGASVVSQNRTNIAAGTYTVTVNDGAGCVDTASAVVSQPTAINVVTTVTNLPCAGGSNGAVDLTVTGGTPTYTYEWTDGQTTKDISGLSVAKTYTVTVTDDEGCEATKSVVVSQSGDLVVTPTVANVKCFGGDDGGITIATTGGTPAFSYAWTGGTTTKDISDLEAGSYTLTVTDNGGCTLVNTYEVTEPDDSLELSAAIINATSFGASDGSLDLIVTGGTPAYTYEWNNNSTDEDLVGVEADEYCVIVTDLNQCTATRCFTVDQPSGIDEANWVDAFKVFTSGSNLNIHIALKEQASYTVGLYDIAGNLLSGYESKNVTKEEKTISTSEYAAGYYFLKIESGKRLATRKIFITN